MNNIKIRTAKLGDEIGITKLIKTGLKSKTWLYTGVNKFSPKKIANLKKSLTDRNSGRKTFVATFENRVIAFINYNYRTDGRLRHRISFGWHVHPDYQNKNIGTQLLKFALADAKKNGFKRAEAEMAVKNIPSWKIALKCGFKIEGLKKKALLTDDGKYIDTYLVGKIL